LFAQHRSGCPPRGFDGAGALERVASPIMQRRSISYPVLGTILKELLYEVHATLSA
jgi:hypothetical protein